MDDFLQYDMINGEYTGGGGSGPQNNNNDSCGMVIIRIIVVGMFVIAGLASPIALIIMLFNPTYAQDISFMGVLVFILFTIGDIVFLVWLIKKMKDEYKNSK